MPKDLITITASEMGKRSAAKRKAEGTLAEHMRKASEAARNRPPEERSAAAKRAWETRRRNQSR